jgi:DNA repair exonuclease SbcCD nuclease subunit
MSTEIAATGRAVPTVRFLHASDVHVDDRPDGTLGLRLLVEAARAHQVDLVLLVGDTFDHNRVHPETLQAFVDALSLLEVPVVVLPGNHDPLMDGSVYERIELPGHVHLMRLAEGDVVELEDLELELWGRAHTSFADNRPLTDVPPRGSRPWQVALAHGHLVRYPDDRHRSYLITSEEISACDRDYVALGHWDVQHDVSAGGVTAWYSGSPSRKGACTLVTLSVGQDGDRTVAVQPLTLA